MRDGTSAFERVRARGNQLAIERSIEAVVLRGDRAPGRRGVSRPVEDRREVEAARLPMIQRRPDVQPIDSTDHLVHRPEAELRHVLADFLRDEPEEVLDELRLAREPLPKLGILRGDADGARIQMADAHHDAARRRRAARSRSRTLRRPCSAAITTSRPVFIWPSTWTTMRSRKPVHAQHLLRLGEPQLPRDAAVLDARERRRAGAAVVTGDQDHVGVRLGDAGGNRADTRDRHQLDRDARRRIGVLQVVESAAPDPRSNRCRGAAAAR